MLDQIKSYDQALFLFGDFFMFHNGAQFDLVHCVPKMASVAAAQI